MAIRVIDQSIVAIKITLIDVTLVCLIGKLVFALEDSHPKSSLFAEWFSVLFIRITKYLFSRITHSNQSNIARCNKS